MVGRDSVYRRIFVLFNTIFLIGYSLLCILPFINMLAVSFSNSSAASAGEVAFWPVGFNTKSYTYVLHNKEFWQSLLVSFERVVLGILINMFLTILTAYPLSKEKKDFRHRTICVWFFVFTMLFGGGLIPFYITVKMTGLIDSIWALVIPGAIPVFNAIILLNFFRGLPKEMEESAFIDGAGHWTILWKIFVPTSIPALATLVVFTIVSHWNSWFDGMILMNKSANYPLQTYLQSIVVQQNNAFTMSKATAKLLQYISDRTVKAAQIFIGAIPVLLIYPFAQKYFITGIVLGSVKE